MIRLPPASRALIAFPDAILGLTPQALCCRPLRGLSELRLCGELECKRYLMRQVCHCLWERVSGEGLSANCNHNVAADFSPQSVQEFFAASAALKTCLALTPTLSQTERA